MADRRMWKMSPERLQEHLKLRSRASRIPDKKKEQSKTACRNSRRAFPLFGAENYWVIPNRLTLPNVNY